MLKFIGSRNSQIIFAIITILGLSAFSGPVTAKDKKTKYSMDDLSDKQMELYQKCGIDDATGTYIFVVPMNLRNGEGNLRVHTYYDKPEEFLESGYGFKNDVKAQEDDNAICVKMPKAGDYAITVMHDRNANGKADIFSEGFGFSNNPKLGLSKPKYKKVVTTVPKGKTVLFVKMTYIFGKDKKKEDRRRRMRRN